VTTNAAAVKAMDVRALRLSLKSSPRSERAVLCTNSATAPPQMTPDQEWKGATDRTGAARQAG
jgi:hypothetical protein